MDKRYLYDSYNVGGYLRLSNEDLKLLLENKLESNSISNQKALVSQEIESMSNVSLYDYYVDDGFSGVNFERPDFQRLLNDISAGKVNMVIVKDLSRLGRDYIETGNCVRNIFPSMGVRFISILDHFDNLTATQSEINLLIPVKNFVNDNYSRDISLKIRSNQRVMRNQGLYIGSFVAYGYQKMETDKKQIVIDEYAADIVRKIFNWKILGLSQDAIAERLNYLGVMPPSRYKEKLGINYKSGFQTKKLPKWSAVTVTRILTNKIYIGILEQGKRRKISYKVGKVVENPEMDWSVIENAHEAIISQSDFYNVERLLKADMRISAGSNTAHVFGGILFCGECQRSMHHKAYQTKRSAHTFFVCATYNKGKGCSRHRVDDDTLKKLLLYAITQHVNDLLEVQELLAEVEARKIKYEDVIANNKQIEEMIEELDGLRQKSLFLHQSLAEGIISFQEYKDFEKIYSDKREETEQSIKNIGQAVKELFHRGLQSNTWIDEFKKYRNITDIDRFTVVTLVKRITVYENDRVEIQFNYQDEYFQLLQMLNGIREGLLEVKEVV